MNIYTAASPGRKELVHLSQNDRYSLCSQPIANKKQRVWRQRNPECLERLDLCRVCGLVVRRRK